MLDCFKRENLEKLREDEQNDRKASSLNDSAEEWWPVKWFMYVHDFKTEA